MSKIIVSYNRKEKTICILDDFLFKMYVYLLFIKNNYLFKNDK